MKDTYHLAGTGGSPGFAAAASFVGAAGAVRDRPRALRPASRLYRGVGKRSLDIALVLAGLPVALPLIAGAALLVMRDGGRPFFGHWRVGRGGRVFRCWKIRSMTLDAESRLQAHLASDAAARAEWEATYKLTNDPRITPIGHFLRRISLDELPQLWNVLKGEMSLVGPRPVTDKELALYGAAVRHYKAVRPGLTGLWQVGGRNDVSYEERVTLDVAYARHHSIAMDLNLLLKTIGVVVGRTGR